MVKVVEKTERNTTYTKTQHKKVTYNKSTINANKVEKTEDKKVKKDRKNWRKGIENANTSKYTDQARQGTVEVKQENKGREIQQHTSNITNTARKTVRSKTISYEP